MAEQQEAQVAPPPIGCGGKLMLFVPVWLLGSFLSIFLLYRVLAATGPDGPDSAMGNGLGAVLLAPIGGFLAGLAALAWQSRYDPQGKRSGMVALACLVTVALAIVLGESLFV